MAYQTSVSSLTLPYLFIFSSSRFKGLLKVFCLLPHLHCSFICAACSRAGKICPVGSGSSLSSTWSHGLNVPQWSSLLWAERSKLMAENFTTGRAHCSQIKSRLGDNSVPPGKSKELTLKEQLEFLPAATTTCPQTLFPHTLTHGQSLEK